MAKLIFKEYDDDIYATQNGQTLRVVDKDVRKYSLSAEHKPYAPVGALNFSEAETIYHTTHPRGPHDVWASYYNIHNSRFELQFNILRIVVDILNGKDVIIFRGYWDDWSIELFRDFLYKKYGLMMHNWSGDYDLIPEAEFNPISRYQFAEEMNMFENVVVQRSLRDGINYDHINLGMIYPYTWNR